MVKYIVLDLRARGRQGCCHSVSSGPTGSEAENVFPAGTRAQSTHMHHTHTYRQTAGRAGHRQTLRAFTKHRQCQWLRPAPLSGWAGQGTVSGSIWTHAQGGSIQELGLLRDPSWWHLDTWAPKAGVPVQLLAPQIPRQKDRQTHRG